GASGGAVFFDDLKDFVLGENMVRALGHAQNSFHQLRLGLDVSLPEPVEYVRFAAHVPDLDLLLAPEHAGGHAGVDAVGEEGVAFVLRFDDRGRVHAGGGAERV